jgi:hypothetical protein
VGEIRNSPVLKGFVMSRHRCVNVKVNREKESFIMKTGFFSLRIGSLGGGGAPLIW